MLPLPAQLLGEVVLGLVFRGARALVAEVIACVRGDRRAKAAHDAAWWAYATSRGFVIEGERRFRCETDGVSVSLRVPPFGQPTCARFEAPAPFPVPEGLVVRTVDDAPPWVASLPSLREDMESLSCPCAIRLGEQRFAVTVDCSARDATELDTAHRLLSALARATGHPSGAYR